MKVKENKMKINDNVLVKYDAAKYKNKHQSLFDPKPYKISEKRGSMVIAKRPDHTITRNSSYFKHVNIRFTKTVERQISQTFMLRFIDQDTLNARLAKAEKDYEIQQAKTTTKAPTNKQNTDSNMKKNPLKKKLIIRKVIHQMNYQNMTIQ
jgi:hypothetical protein